MTKAIILRRRKLGRTSAREVARFAQEAGVDIKEYRNDKPWPGDVDIVFRWGTTSNTQGRPIIVNESKDIHAVADKKGSRMILSAKGMAPESWTVFADFNREYNLLGRDIPVKGWVVRKSVHAQGRNLHHCTTVEQVGKACALYGEGNYYISLFIDKVEEYRVFVCQGRAVWVAKKTPADEKAITWNVAKGGRFDNVRWGDWKHKVVRAAVEAAREFDIDFTGVDIMVDGEGKCYVLELNSAPSQTSPYRQECTSKAFQYIVNNGKARLPLGGNNKGYLSLIHPALTANAIME